MAYTKQTWANLPSKTTPISAQRLNHMEDGIYDANQVATQNTNGQMSSTDKTKFDNTYDGTTIDSFGDVESEFSAIKDGTTIDSFGDVETEFSNIKDGTTIDSFGDVETALSGKQATLTFDDAPTDNSDNPVKSNGIYDALADKMPNYGLTNNIEAVLDSGTGDYVLRTKTISTISESNPYSIPTNSAVNEAFIQIVARRFTAIDSYAVGDHVMEDGKFYRCTTAHQGVWDASHFTAVKVVSEFEDAIENVYKANGVTGAKNLWDIEKQLKDGTVTYTKNGNAYTLNPIKSAKYQFADSNINVIVTGSIANGTATSAVVKLLDASDNVVQTSSANSTFTLSGSGCKIQFSYNDSGSATLTEPMIRLATDTDATFVPNAMTNKELTEKVAESKAEGISNTLFRFGNMRVLNMRGGTMADAISLVANDLPSSSNAQRGTVFNFTDNKITVASISSSGLQFIGASPWAVHSDTTKACHGELVYFV